MKFTLIAAVVLLALAQGSFAQEAANVDIAQALEDFRTRLTQDMATLVGNPDLAAQAETFLQEKKTQLEPLVAQLQEQAKTVAAQAQAQFQPMVESLQAQMQAFIQTLTEKANAAAN